MWIKAQEDAGLDVIGDGEHSRQHFVHVFLERVAGIDFEHKVEMGCRDRYKAMVPQVVGPLSLAGRVHQTEVGVIDVASDVREHQASAELQGWQLVSRQATSVG